MLHHLGQLLAEVSGPFRLLTSFLFLASLGGALGYLITCSLLPKVWKFLPTDKGRVGQKRRDRSRDFPTVYASPIFARSQQVVNSDGIGERGHAWPKHHR